MIRIFGKGRDLIVVDNDVNMTEEDKKGSIVFNNLPKQDKEMLENHIAELFLDDKNNLKWIYIPKNFNILPSDEETPKE